MKKVLALVLAMIMVASLVGVAMADTSTPSITINPANPDSVENVAIGYTWYRILEADIGTDPVVGTDGATTTHGVVAYYVTTQDRANQLDGTGLFNISKVEDQDKWYVEVKSTTTSAQDLVNAFSAGTFDLTKFATGTFDKGTAETSAESGNLAAGYYYITSTLGSKIALQTLTAVTINEKNDYVTDDKIIPDADKNSEIGQTIDYNLTVNVPITANQQIVLTDTMSKGLTFKEIVSQTPIEGTVSTPVAVDENDPDKGTKFTITYTADQIKGLVANQTVAQTITVVVRVLVNGEAAIETDIPNTLDLKYGNEYDATPKTVNTKTYDFDFDKVDGNTKLTGAEFKLTKESSNDKDSTDNWIQLIEVEAGKTYRLKTADDTATAVDTIVTNGNTVTINGLDIDQTYYLVETKAPTGYNILDAHVEVPKNQAGTEFVHADVQNNKGTELPSTGGIGTTIFYVAGLIMVLGAATILIARRKADAE